MIKSNTTVALSYECLPWCSICKRSGHYAHQHNDWLKIQNKKI